MAVAPEMKRQYPNAVGRKVFCDYCDGEATLVDSSRVYSKSYGPIWYCEPCGAWVGVHKTADKKGLSCKPLGRLANAKLRRAKMHAHEVFDRLWVAKIRGFKWPKNKARRAAYAWLAKEMGIAHDECHIGNFDEAQCAKVIEICGSIKPRNKTAKVSP